MEPLDVRIRFGRHYFQDQAEHQPHSPFGDQAVPVTGTFGRADGRNGMEGFTQMNGAPPWRVCAGTHLDRSSRWVPRGEQGTLRGEEHAHEGHVHEVMSMGTQDESMLMD